MRICSCAGLSYQCGEYSSPKAGPLLPQMRGGQMSGLLLRGATWPSMLSAEQR